MDVSLKETRVSLKEMHFSLKETRFTQGKIAKIAPKAPQEGGPPNSLYTQHTHGSPLAGFFTSGGCDYENGGVRPHTSLDSEPSLPQGTLTSVRSRGQTIHRFSKVLCESVLFRALPCPCR